MNTVIKNNANNIMNEHQKIPKFKRDEMGVAALFLSFESWRLLLYMWRSIDCVAASLLVVYAVVDSFLDSWLMPLVQSSHWNCFFLVYIPWVSAGYT